MQEQTQQTEQLTNNTRRLTQAIARRYVQALGGKCNRTGFGSELRVQLAGCEYFTESVEDAIGTARYIAQAHSHVGARLEAAEAVLAQDLRQDVLMPEKLTWTEVRS